MKNMFIKASAIALLAIGFSTSAQAGFSAYGSYWNSDQEGFGAGVKYEKRFLADFVAADVSAGYIDFSSEDTQVIPLETSLTLRIPFFIEPYAGLGVGYYPIESDNDYQSSTGYFGVVGIQATILGIGALAEYRYLDAKEEFLDGNTFNLGLTISF